MIPKLYSTVALPGPLDLFGQLLAQAPFAVWVADRSGKLILFNEAMRALVDIDDPERILETYNIFEDPIAMAQGLVPYIKRVLTGQIIQTVVMLDLSREGFNLNHKKEPKVFYVRCLYFPLRNDRGDFEYVVLMVENITQEYLEDIALSRSAREVEEAGKEIVDREKRIIALKARKRALEKRLAKLKGV